MRSIVRGSALWLLGIAMFPATSSAADGALDTSFSSNGVQTVSFALGAVPNDRASAAAVQADGKLVVVGSAGYTATDTDFAFARLNTDGSPDSGFGAAGKQSVAFDLESATNTQLLDRATSVAIQPDGDVVACGVARNAAGNYQLAVARTLANGGPDTSFSGDGRVDLPPSPSGGSAGSCDLELLRSTALLLTATDRLVRLTSGGAIDNGFSSDGYSNAVGACSTTYDYCLFRDSLELPDGRILTGGFGYVNATDSFTPLLFRHTSTGTLDSDFGNGGALALDKPGHAVERLVLTPHGLPLAFLSNSDTFAGDDMWATRLVDQSVDTTFGSTGWLDLDALVPGSYMVQDLAVASDGKLLVLARDGFDADPQLVLRLLPSGTALDSTFDGDGKQSFQFDPGFENGFARAIVATDGRPYAVGTVFVQSDDDFGMARFTSALVFTDGFEVGSTWFWSSATD